MADRGNFGIARCTVGRGKETIYPLRVEVRFVDFFSASKLMVFGTSLEQSNSWALRVLDLLNLEGGKQIWAGLHINPLNTKLNPICYLLALSAHHFLHVSRIRVKSLTLRLLMSYIYGALILDVSRSHTTTQHSR